MSKLHSPPFRLGLLDLLLWACPLSLFSSPLFSSLSHQHHQFHHYNPGKSEFGEERYFKITKRIYGELDARLKDSKFLAGHDYTIADIATWPWMARHEWHDIGLKNYKNLSRWYLEISEREAVVKGYAFMDKEAKIPKP